ncbi:hypothetical protein Tco_0476115 [Tanacetum coccineum]
MDTIRAQQKHDDEIMALAALQNSLHDTTHLRSLLMYQKYTCKSSGSIDMLKIFPKLPGQEFEEPPLEEEILSFIRDLGHTGEIKFLSDVNVNHMHQPWRSFAAIINKCLSGKTIALESLRLSRAQILWGMYHNKTVDYVYLLWEDLVLSSMAKEQAIQGKQDVLTMPWMMTSYFTFEAYMTYRAYATGEKTPKPKSTKKKADSESSPKTKLTQASKGKRIKTLAKRDKPAKKKQFATKSKGLTVLYEVALTKAEQMKIALERRKIQTHSSLRRGSSSQCTEYRSESERRILDNSSQGEDDEENDEHDSEDDNDEHDSKNDNDDEDDDQENVMVLNPPDYEILDEEENQEDDDNVMGGEQEDQEDEEMYGDLNLNLDKRDVEMTDAQTNQETEEVHVTLTTKPPVVQQQSSFVSLNLVSKLLIPLWIQILGVAWYKGNLLKGKFCFIQGDDYISNSGEALAL